jgi:hypothetical protein
MLRYVSDYSTIKRPFTGWEMALFMWPLSTSYFGPRQSRMLGRGLKHVLDKSITKMKNRQVGAGTKKDSQPNGRLS